jgi:N-acetylated-alpha-linked acidic dipeptidase
LELNLDSLKSAIDTFASAAEYMNARISALSESSDTASIRLLNRQLYLAERLFLSDEGLVSRRWFKHVVQAPGLDTGYGAVVFPGVWDTVSRGDLDGATSALQILNTRMLHISEYLRATQQ